MSQPAANGLKGSWLSAVQSGFRLLSHFEGLSPAPPPVAEAVDVTRLAGLIRYGTIELASLHEAGHVAAAFAARARVLRVDIAGVRQPSGRTRVLSTAAEQRRSVALGGFAVELQLWREGRLAWFDGGRPSEPDMRRGIAGSAQDDRAKYFEGDQRTPDGRWPAALDDTFFQAADDLRSRLDPGLIRRVAEALYTKYCLGEREVAVLAATPLFERVAAPSPTPIKPRHKVPRD